MKYREKREDERKHGDIIIMLPSFINQLLLLMNSGAALENSFEKIAESYEKIPDNRKTYFEVSICNIYNTGKKTGESNIVGFYKFARLSNVKELNRVAGIMMENRDKGTELWQKLAEQADALWTERKRIATEKVRLAESKMSFPLGVLLISLIIITAAPAMMQI